jgi:hypothetical protein
MSLYPDGLPWLNKPAAVLAAGGLILDSAAAALGLVGYMDIPDVRRARWLPPGGSEQARRIRGYLGAASHGAAPRENLGTCLRSLVRLRRHLPVGSFVFVLSDFLAPPPPAMWEMVSSLGWDVVPVIVQDPLWEQSFPRVDGLVVPFADPQRGRVQHVRLRRGEAEERRRANEARLDALRTELRQLGLEPIVIGSATEPDVLQALTDWGETRLAVRRGEW